VIVGITGKKGHGKDTVGEAFTKKGFQRDSFAAPLKEAVKVALGMTDEQVHGTVDVKETVDPRYGITPRWALQSMGTEWGRNLINEDVWSIACLSRIENSGTEDWVITDTRFVNEADLIREKGGIIIKVVRPGANTGEFENHSSEQQVDLIKPDHTIINDGTIKELEAQVQRLVEKLQSGR